MCIGHFHIVTPHLSIRDTRQRQSLICGIGDKHRVLVPLVGESHGVEAGYRIGGICSPGGQYIGRLLQDARWNGQHCHRCHCASGCPIRIYHCYLIGSGMVCGDIGDGDGSGGLSCHGGAIECPGVGHGSEACGSYGELQGGLGIHCIGRGQVDRENRGLGLERDGHCSATYRSIGVTGLDTVSSGNGRIHIGDCQGGPRLSSQCTRPLVPLVTNGQ